MALKRIVGYSDEISVQPGQSINFMVSTYGIESYTARLERLIHGDVNPAGPGFKSSVVEEVAAVQCHGREQKVHCGSYGVVKDCRAVGSWSRGLTLQAYVWATTPTSAPGNQTVMRCESKSGAYVEIGVDPSGSAYFMQDGKTISTGRRLHRKQWYLVRATVDEKGRAFVEQLPISSRLSNSRAAAGEDMGGISLDSVVDVWFAGHTADDGEVCNRFNGKIDRPRVASAALGVAESSLLADPVPADMASLSVVGAWDFSADMGTQRFADISANQNHGVLVNMPTRAMKGANWDGSAMGWTQNPSQYGAIHFHDDDIYDAGWDVDFSFRIPDGLSSGVYAAHLESTDGDDYIPFVVRPPRGGASSEILLVLPTASYLAYANEHMPTDAPLAQLLTDQVVPLQAEDLFLAEHREFGGSNYDVHSDGSGIAYSSRLRPILNMRPKYADWLGGSGSALWQFNADLHITDWLESMGYSFDVISDEDLHREGADILSRYRLVMTGTHPEYTSTKMRDAFETYTQSGGRFMYLGGNGFYWRISFSDDAPGVIEIRRGEGGIRAWAAEPGEYYNAFTGEYSGLWRRSGRPPQQLAGVGFTTQGFDVSSYYRRSKESYEDPRVSWIFDGIDDEIIGDFGLIGGGAAGLELDRADVELGTPEHAVVLGSSEDHTDVYLVVLEEILINSPGLHGRLSPLVRSDLVFFETVGGGAVFSTGSIAFCGSLSHNEYRNNVSALMKNIVDRFVDPEPFQMPIGC